MRIIPTRPHGTNFCNSSARFKPSFVRQPKGPECTQIVQNAPKRQFRVQWGGSGAFVVKNLEATSWHKLLHQFGPFCNEFRNSTKRSQMHQNCTNAPKHEFRVHWGGSGAFIAKNSDTTSWDERLHQFGPFCTEFQKSTKWSQMHQNCTNAPNMSLGSNGVYRVRWLRKIPTRLRGTNFCTNSAYFALSFVTQPNGPKCT